ncbi:MAG: carboxypeptidase regulatory-like domain-containing protein [Desulfobacterales bacterium]|nr:carboxypeptidase regulatory-like domain-containing protein [Desulfobacterales bacterium]
MRLKNSFVVFLAVITLALVGCGWNYPIQGQVVDAETGQPVEGAVVAVRWTHYYLTPMGTARDEYGTTEVITDAQGHFTVPKYPFASHFMGAYKKGYICWSSEDIFKTEGDPASYGSYGRLWHRVKDGMVVEIAPIKRPSFPEFEHARFTNNVRRMLDSLKFSTVTHSEYEIEYRRTIMNKE